MVQILGLAGDSENSPSELRFHFRVIKDCSLGSERFMEQVDLLSERSHLFAQPEIIVQMQNFCPQV